MHCFVLLKQCRGGLKKAHSVATQTSQVVALSLLDTVNSVQTQRSRPALQLAMSIQYLLRHQRVCTVLGFEQHFAAQDVAGVETQPWVRSNNMLSCGCFLTGVMLQITSQITSQH
jgi:hypothetical protein